MIKASPTTQPIAQAMITRLVSFGWSWPRVNVTRFQQKGKSDAAKIGPPTHNIQFVSVMTSDEDTVEA